MRKIPEVLRLHYECGRSNREIAGAVRVSPTTVSDYLRRARLAGLAWPLDEELTIARADGRYLKLIGALTKVDVLVLDDWGLAILDGARRRDLLAVCPGTGVQFAVERLAKLGGIHTQAGILATIRRSSKGASRSDR